MSATGLEEGRRARLMFEVARALTQPVARARRQRRIGLVAQCFDLCR